MDAEVLRVSVFSAFIASLRFAWLGILLAASPRCVSAVFFHLPFGRSSGELEELHAGQPRIAADARARRSVGLADVSA